MWLIVTKERPGFIDGSLSGTVSKRGAKVDTFNDGDRVFGISYESVSTSVRAKASFFRKIEGDNAAEVGRAAFLFYVHV